MTNHKVTMTALTGIGAVFCWFALSQGRQPEDQEFKNVGLVYNPLVALGGVDLNRTVTARLVIENKSARNLTLSQFDSGCSCTKIYTLDKSNHKYQLQTLDLAAGQSATVMTDIAVAGEVGISQLRKVSFVDGSVPAQTHSIAITYTPMTSLFILPKALNFGRFYRGDAVHLDVALRSDGSFREKVSDVKLIGLDDLAIQARCAEVGPSDEIGYQTLAGDTGRILGKLTFTINETTAVSAMVRNVQLQINGKWNVPTSLCLQPLDKSKFTPDVVVLPRRIGDQQEAQAESVRTSVDQILQFECDSEVPGVLMVQELQSTPNSRKIRVTLDPQHAASRADLTSYPIRYLCKTANGTQPVTFTVVAPRVSR